MCEWKVLSRGRNTFLLKKDSRFDTKQPPFRILFQREVNTNCLQIAVGETETAIEAAWLWIEHNMIPELDTIDDPFEKEQWVVEKISMIVTTIGKQGNPCSRMGILMYLSRYWHR